MTKLVEESNDFIVLKERRLIFRRFGEIANQGCGWISPGAIGVQISWLKREVGSMAIFSLSWVKIEIEVANESTTFTGIVPDAEDLDILMP